MFAIRLTRLTKDYGDVRALDELDLTVEPGQVFGFLGPNGAGKTTALRILLDLIRPTSGHAEVLGFDAQSESIEVRRRVGYLPDDPQMYEGMTGRRFLEFMSSLRGTASNDGGATAFRDSLCERLQLDPMRRIGTLSRGNRQKVGVVLALMERPQLVVLDEPTTGLDPLVREEVELLLREVAADGRTVFFSSHVLSEVEQVCDRVAMLRNGRLIDVLEPREERRLAPQRFTVTFAAGGAPASEVLAAIDGVSVISATPSEVVLETVGGADALLKCLAGYTVTRLETHEVSLEELFLSYYQPEAAAGRGS